MKPQRAHALLEELDSELRTLVPRWKSTEFRSWVLRARSVLTRAVGEHHPITESFRNLDWTSWGADTSQQAASDFEEARILAYGIIEAAIAEVDLQIDEVPIADEAGIDPELWERVSPEVQAEAWDKVALNAVVFTEDRIRKWAGRPPDEVGKDLAVGVFGNNGNYRMGLVDGEKEGWQLFAQGIARALRNVDTHRIQQRADHKRYALGVVGACSLLLTQMRWEHGNRFVDTSPASAEGGEVEP